MSKKRVYELARELGIENKELIARLEKLGITVKSHSSTLEDADVGRVQRDMLSGEPHELVEKRINKITGLSAASLLRKTHEQRIDILTWPARRRF